MLFRLSKLPAWVLTGSCHWTYSASWLNSQVRNRKKHSPPPILRDIANDTTIRRIPLRGIDVWWCFKKLQQLFSPIQKNWKSGVRFPFENPPKNSAFWASRMFLTQVKYPLLELLGLCSSSDRLYLHIETSQIRASIVMTQCERYFQHFSGFWTFQGPRSRSLDMTFSFF